MRKFYKSLLQTLVNFKHCRVSLLVLLFGFLSVEGWGQVSITTIGAAVTQNFDGMGNSGTASLPMGFKLSPTGDWSMGTTVTTLAYGTTGTGAITGTSSAGEINWANGVNASSTDRSIGFLTSGSFISPRSIVYAFTNNTGLPINSISINFDYEKYRSGSRQFDWTFFHGSTPTPSIAAATGDQSYAADANNTVISNPPTSINKSVTLNSLSVPDGGTYYLAWTFTGLGGSSNGQGIGIDNFSITATSNCTPPINPTGSITPAANPACNSTVLVFNNAGATSYWQTSAAGTSTALPATTPLTVTTSGNYYVREYNGTCWSTGALASSAITINIPVVITNDYPASVSTFSPNATSFSLTGGITGTITSYTWESSDDAGATWSTVNGSVYSGVNNITLNISSTTGLNGILFRCVVIGPCGTVTSGSATLTVNEPTYLWYNPINGVNLDPTDGYTSNQQVAANLAVSGISKGTGITGVISSNRYNAKGWNSTFDPNDYFEFILTPSSGFKMDFTNLVYTSQTSPSNPPSSFAIRSSVDGFTANIFLPGPGGGTSSLASASFQGIVGPIIFRIYAWGGSNADATFSINDFTFNGKVTSVCGLPAAPVANSNTSPQTSGLFSNAFNANWSQFLGGTGYSLDVSLYPTFSTTAANATTLFFSEYVEGNGNEKYLEIFNGTGASVPLGNYKIRKYPNGSSTPTEFSLTGSLPNNSVLVLKNSGASNFTGTATVATQVIDFNGDDAIELFNSNTSTSVDIFGSIGEDPGTAWTSSGGYSTLDKTLVRNSNVNGGITFQSTGFPTLASQWTLYNVGDVSHLGTHTFSGGSVPSFLSGYNGFVINGDVITAQLVSGLSTNTDYYYRIRSVSGCGSSVNSNVVKVTTSDFTTADFRSKQTGNYNTFSTWEYFNGSAFIAATTGQVPGPNNNVTIQSPHVITVDVSPTFNTGKTLTVNSGGSIVFPPANVASGAGNFVLSGGATLQTGNVNGITSGTTASGSVQVTGTRAYDAGANYRYNGTANQVTGNGLPPTLTGTLTIANTGISPDNVVTLTQATTLASTTNFIGGALNLNALTLTISNSSATQSIAGSGNNTFSMIGAAGSTLSLTGTATTHVIALSNFDDASGTGLIVGPNVNVLLGANAQLDCGGNGNNKSMLTIRGQLTLNSASFSNIHAGNAPFFTNTSTLIYKVGYNVLDEWGNGTDLTKAGVPQNVIIDAFNAVVTMPTSMGGNRSCKGNLTITNGTFVLNGSSGILSLGGNWLRQNSGTTIFNPNGKTVIFNGAAVQNIQVSGTGTNKETFVGLTVNNTSGGVTLSSLVDVSASGLFTLTSGIVTTSAVNILSVLNTSNSSIIGGSTTSFINGPVEWKLPVNNSSNINFLFPVGKSTYLPFTLVKPLTGAAGPVIKVEAFALTPPNASFVDKTTVEVLSTTEHWVATASLGNLTNASVSLARQTSINPATVIAWSNDPLTIKYSSIGGSVAASAINNSTPVSNLGTFAISASCPVLNFDYNGITQSCTSAGTISVRYLNGGGAGTFTSSPSLGTALNATTGSINLSLASPGTYVIRNTAANTCTNNFEFTITVTPNNTVSTASSAPTCINTTLTAITHTTTGATGIGTATGLPAGVTAAFASNTITISGTPTASGTFNYSIPLTGGCGTVSATGTITVTPNNTVSAASASPTPCINTTLPAITHTTTGATGIGIASGLPAGVTAAFAANTITISGTPTASGTLSYTIPLTGGCGTVNATGTITVTPNNTASAASASPTPCINTTLPAITHTTTGATGIGTATGLPAGVTAAFASNTITISGTPTASGTFSYTIPLTGGCGTVSATGTITVTNDITWIGTTPNWNDPTNWSCGVVPTATSNVIINNTSPQPQLTTGPFGRANNLTLQAGTNLIISGNELQIGGSLATGGGTITATSGKITFNGTAAQAIPPGVFTLNNVKDIEINNGANVTLQGPLNIISGNAPGSVTVNAGTFITGNNLTIKSDLNGTGRIAQSALTNYLTGNVTVERFIPSHARRAFRLLAPSVNSSGSINANWQEGRQVTDAYNLSDPTPLYNLGTHITGSTTAANGFDATITGQPSLQLNPTGLAWVPIANTNSLTLNAKTGYMLFMRGDRTRSNIASNTNFTSSTTLRATGSVLMGDQTYSPLQPNGYNLVTNPYAAPIKWDKVFADNPNIDGSYVFYDASLGMRGGYVSVNTSGNSSVITAGVTGTSSANLNIQSGQGFFIKTTGANSITIKESHKSDVNTVKVFRNARLYSSLHFMFDGNRVLADGVNSIFDNAYSKEVDGDDAPDLAAFDENIAINRKGKLLSIEGRPVVVGSDTIPLAISRLRAVQYEWQFDPFNFSSGQTAFLVDKFLDKRTALDLSAKKIVAFQVTAEAASFAADRFMIVIEGSNALPVDAITLKAYRQNEKVQVDWNVAGENNIDHYEVERSEDGRQFVKRGNVPATANNNGAAAYHLVDENVTDAAYYYRIKVVGRQGYLKYSPVVQVNAVHLPASVRLYPNPVTGREVRLQVENLSPGKYSLVFYNALGQQTKQANIVHPSGKATYTVALGKMEAGAYQLKISGDNKHEFNLRFTRE